MRLFGPVYCVTAILSTAAVYRWAPLAQPYFARLFDGGDTPPQSLAIGDEEALVVRPLRGASLSRALAPPPPMLRPPPHEEPPAPARRAPIDATEQPAAALAPPPPEPASPPAEAPDARGVRLVSRGDLQPKWGLVMRRAEYFMMDGLPTGFLEFGKRIDFRSIRYTPRGALVEFKVDGPRGIPTTPYLISHTNLCLFTGSYDGLSAQEMRDVIGHVVTGGEAQDGTGALRPAVLPTGVQLVSRGDVDPAWGVVVQRATLYRLDGARTGFAAAGACFDYLKTVPSSGGPVVVCRLRDAEGQAGDRSLIGLKDVCLFTGDPAALAARQRQGLRDYYALNGRIIERRNELLRASSAQNPFFPAYQATYKTLMAHIEKSQVEVYRRDHAVNAEKVQAQERLFAQKMEEKRLTMEYEAAQGRFAKWKREHAGELRLPEDDRDIAAWTHQKCSLATELPGLAF